MGENLIRFILSLAPSMARVTTMYLTWLFYAPAIILLALSVPVGGYMNLLAS